MYFPDMEVYTQHTIQKGPGKLTVVIDGKFSTQFKCHSWWEAGHEGTAWEKRRTNVGGE